MTRYRKLPLEVDAWQFIGRSNGDSPAWVREAISAGDVSISPNRIAVRSREGIVVGFKQYWLVKGVEKELYLIDGSIFAKTYERAR